MDDRHGRVWKIAITRRLVENEYIVQVDIHRDTTRTYINPKALDMLYRAIGRYSIHVNMVAVGMSVVTIYYIGDRNVLLV